MRNQRQRREIDLHRRVCVVEPERIEIRPARSAAAVPLLGLLIGVFAAIAAVLLLEHLPFMLAVLLLGIAIMLVPLSGMGFVYSIYGASAVIDKNERWAVWQQGILGLGVGTKEVVPFGKIERIDLVDTSREGQADGPDDLAQYEILLVKADGGTLSLGQVAAPRHEAADGLARARDAAQAIARLTDKPLQVTVDEGRPRRRRRRRRRRRESAEAHGYEHA